ncbi:hypothetical protein [Geomicrobium sp. JCM 19039]|uniref:hypothetical protein n=1 Tax=Geomicrobium sp. JCM 19039 TaxID=1460636 RepID=UPI0005A8DD24|nr:hypothetical protein [Geomicrobium sp. JCM 19039]
MSELNVDIYNVEQTDEGTYTFNVLIKNETNFTIHRPSLILFEEKILTEPSGSSHRVGNKTWASSTVSQSDLIQHTTELKSDEFDIINHGQTIKPEFSYSLEEEDSDELYILFTFESFSHPHTGEEFNTIYLKEEYVKQ